MAHSQTSVCVCVQVCLTPSGPVDLGSHAVIKKHLTPGTNTFSQRIKVSSREFRRPSRCELLGTVEWLLCCPGWNLHCGTARRGHSRAKKAAAGGGARSRPLRHTELLFRSPLSPATALRGSILSSLVSPGSGGIPGEAASRSPREKSPKSRRGRGRLGALQSRRAEGTEPEPEPARAPARPPRSPGSSPPAAPSTLCALP